MIDSHIHIDDCRFDVDRQQLLTTARESGISGFVVPATVAKGFAKVKLLADNNLDIFPAYGLHPYFIRQHTPQDLGVLVDYLKTHNAVALGECGLDYYQPNLDRNNQQYYFEEQVIIAKELNLPLILHVNGAVQAVFDGLKKYDYYNAVMHSFNGSAEQARQITETGILLGFGAAAINPKATKLRQLVKSVAIEHMVLETDAPDQPLYDQAQHRNLPMALWSVAEGIADIKNITVAELTQAADNNCRQVFGI